MRSAPAPRAMAGLGEVTHVFRLPHEQQANTETGDVGDK